jgi:hypothetical protein
MEGYSETLFQDAFKSPFSDYTKEGFESQIFADDQAQIDKLNDLDTKKKELDQKVTNYNTALQELDGTNDPVFDYYNDFSGNKLAFNRKPNIRDAAKEDIDTMIVQQNNTYILGMITVTTLLVSTFLFMRN